jgi:hypothetical protein
MFWLFYFGALMKHKQLENCPFCKGELESGYLQGNVELFHHGMLWRNDADIKRSWWKRNLGFTKRLPRWKYRAQHCNACSYYFFQASERPLLQQADSRDKYKD